MRVFLELGVYYVLLMAVMPWLRRWVSARVCAMLWLLPDWIYVFVGRLDLPTDGKKLVLHAPGVLVYVLLAIWVVGAVGVMVWKSGSHLAFRRRILKNAVPVTDRQTLHVWEIELERAWIRKCKWKLVRSDAVTTPLSIGLYNRTTRIVLPMREYTQEELSLILRHEIIHISRGDPEAKLFLTFCTAMCWFNPLMWAAMRKSADDFELSCDESVLLDEPQPVRRQYAELLLQTAGDERGFTTCLSATAGALRYRLKAVMKPEKKRTGAILIGLTLFVLAMCSGYVALAYDAQPGTQRIFDGQDLSAVTVSSVDPWNDPRGRDGTCMDEDALKDYLASLEPELYTEKLDEYASGEQRELTVMFDTPQGRLSVRLLDQAVHVTRLWDGPDFHSDSYYLKTPVDWDYLDTLIAPLPGSGPRFPGRRNGQCPVQFSDTNRRQTETETVLLEPEDWRYDDYSNEDAQEVQLLLFPAAGRAVHRNGRAAARRRAADAHAGRSARRLSPAHRPQCEIYRRRRPAGRGRRGLPRTVCFHIPKRSILNINQRLPDAKESRIMNLTCGYCKLRMELSTRTC